MCRIQTLTSCFIGNLIFLLIILIGWQNILFHELPHFWNKHRWNFSLNLSDSLKIDKGQWIFLILVTWLSKLIILGKWLILDIIQIGWRWMLFLFISLLKDINYRYLFSLTKSSISRIYFFCFWSFPGTINTWFWKSHIYLIDFFRFQKFFIQIKHKIFTKSCNLFV